jgi:hypothetical protein
LRLPRPDAAKFWGCLAIGLAVTALPVAASITIARDVLRKLVHYDQTGEW